MDIIRDIFEGRCGSHVHPFTGLSSLESQEDIENKVQTLHEAGIGSMCLLWEDPKRTGDVSLFNTETYWQHMQWIVQSCRKYGMTFMIQDAAPFPSGRADGWLDKPEYAHLRKLYLAQRHMDVVGPLHNGRFRVDLLTGSKTTEWLFEGTAPVQKTEDRLLAIIAIKLGEKGEILNEPLDLTGDVDDGILFWHVPDGKWRILVIFETYTGPGRKGFMNLLDQESVALQIQAVYEPHYAHLKGELGKTWIGMFYDEPEVGNLEGHFFTQRVGTPQDLGGKPMSLPWSHEALLRWSTEQGTAWKQKLAYLWYEQADKVEKAVRYSYMELISRLIRDNYHAQIHKWCYQRGIQYIGHALEDENSHCRLSCGPVHLMRMQMHQDMGGIDMIGNQMIPGRDYTQAWYGSAEGDGEFYHYGLAKLGSSIGHIDPAKRGRSVCEVFAVTGALAGTRMRKCIMDHLFVNGITELIPNDPVFSHLDLRFSRMQNLYANRMCHLLTNTKAVIQTAILYHGENEWYEGECMKFQKPAAELARSQISYDVIPSDVFSEREFYQTDCTDGLCINGNRYDALIIPQAKALDSCVLAFLRENQNRCKVFFVNHEPSAEAQTGRLLGKLPGQCVALSGLAEAVRQTVRQDLYVSGAGENLRIAHYLDDNGKRKAHIYMLYNAGNERMRLTLSAAHKGPAYQADLMLMQLRCVRTDAESFGVTLAAQESTLLIFGAQDLEPLARPADTAVERSAVSGSWQLTLAETEQTVVLDALEDLGTRNRWPRYTGKLIYEKEVRLSALPSILDLGEVYETAELWVNGKLAGVRMAPPYRFDVERLVKTGTNTLRLEVVPNQGARHTPTGLVEAVIESIAAAAYCPLAPTGILGPVEWITKTGERT